MSLTTDDIAVLVFTSALNLHERALSCNNSWLKDFRYGYLVGGKCIDSDLKMISAGDFIGEDYASASDKQYYGLKKIYEMYPDKSWYFITGCDAYVFSKNLVNALSVFDCTKDYYVGGDFAKITVLEKSLLMPRGGPGFALSRPLVQKLVARLDELIPTIKTFSPWLQGACDLTMCYFLQEWFGVMPTYVSGFYDWPVYFYPSKLYGDSNGEPLVEPVVDKPVAFHRLSIREMYIISNGQKLKKNSLMRFFDKIQRKISSTFKTKSIFNFIFYKEHKEYGVYQ